MLTPYILMLVVTVCTFELTHAGKNFRGSSIIMPFILNLSGLLGQLSLLGFVIYAMFQTTWWHPLVAAAVIAIATGFISTILSFIFRDLLCIVLWIACLIGLSIASYFMWTFF